MSMQVKTHLIIISYALVAKWKRDYPAAKTLLVLRVQRREEEDRINLIDGDRSLKIALNAKIQHPLSKRLFWPGQLETTGTSER